MENTNTNFVKLLSQLLEKVKALIEKIEKREQEYAQILQKKQEAVLPESEVSKITDAVRDAVRQTPCATPDVEGSAHIIAEKVVEMVGATIQSAVENKIKSTRIKLEHHHTHEATWDIARYAEKRMRRGLQVLGGLCAALLLTIIGGLIWYRNSDIYWGEQYIEMCFSPFVTVAEFNALNEAEGDTIYTGYLPQEYKKNPTLVKEKIRRNQEIIRHREMEAKSNKGKYSTKTPIEL